MSLKYVFFITVMKEKLLYLKLNLNHLQIQVNFLKFCLIY